MELVLISVLSGVAVVALGGAIVLARTQHQATVLVRARSSRDHDLEVSVDESRPRKGWMDSLARLGEWISSGAVSQELQQELAGAGFHHARAGAIYLGAELALLVGGVLGMAGLSLVAEIPLVPTIFLICMGSAVLFFVPKLYVGLRRSQRRKDVQLHLPDAVDMLEICISSGMGLDMAWNMVSDEIRGVSTTLADEMTLTNLEICLGVPRAQAMRHMATRTGAQAISSLVAMLVQADRFGASTAEAFSMFARTMREERSQKAEEIAEKTSVKLLFPMVAFIFPALLIVMVGPAVLELIKVMGGK